MQRKKIILLALGFGLLMSQAFASETEFYEQLKRILDSRKQNYLEKPDWENKVKIYQFLFPQLSKFFNLQGENLAYSGKARVIFYGMASAYADVYFALNFLEKKITAPIFEEIIGEKLKTIAQEFYQQLSSAYLQAMSAYTQAGMFEKQNQMDGILKQAVAILNKTVIQSEKYDSVNKYFCIGYMLAYQFMISLGHYLDNREYHAATIVSYLQSEVYFANENRILKKQPEIN